MPAYYYLGRQVQLKPLAPGSLAQDAGEKAKAMMAKAKVNAVYMQIVDGYFKDDRWANGRWDMSKFAGAGGETDWDKVRTLQCQVFHIAAFHCCVISCTTGSHLILGMIQCAQQLLANYQCRSSP